MLHHWTFFADFSFLYFVTYIHIQWIEQKQITEHGEVISFCTHNFRFFFHFLFGMSFRFRNETISDIVRQKMEFYVIMVSCVLVCSYYFYFSFSLCHIYFLFSFYQQQNYCFVSDITGLLFLIEASKTVFVFHFLFEMTHKCNKTYITFWITAAILCTQNGFRISIDIEEEHEYTIWERYNWSRKQSFEMYSKSAHSFSFVK